MRVPKWVSNKTKYLIAIQKLKNTLTKDGSKITDRNIKEQYMKMGGLVLNDEKNEDSINQTTDLVSETDEKEPKINRSDT